MPGAKAVAIAIGIANGITGKIIAEMGNGRGGRAACIFSIAGVIAKARLNRQRFAQLGVCRAISVAIRPGNRLSVGKPLIAHRRRHALIIANDGVQDFPYFKIALNNNLRIARHRRGSDDEVKMCRLGIGVKMEYCHHRSYPAAEALAVAYGCRFSRRRSLFRLLAAPGCCHSRDRRQRCDRLRRVNQAFAFDRQ